MTQVPMTLTQGQGQRSRSNFPKNGLNTKQLATSWMLFHPQTSSYLLSQLFVTHLGVALLFFFFQYVKSFKGLCPYCTRLLNMDRIEKRGVAGALVLRRHLEVHFDRQVECQYCRAKFPTAFEKHKHIKMVGAVFYVCISVLLCFYLSLS